jgi:hypothetical protein
MDNGASGLSAVAARPLKDQKMTPTDLQLIRLTLAGVAGNPEPFATAFRSRAVTLDRSLAPLLPLVDRAQAARIVETMALVLDGLDAADSTAAKEKAFALRHRWAGIQPRHYAAVGQALLDALASRLGTSFGDNARAAWASAFVLLAEALMARSYNPLGLVA